MVGLGGPEKRRVGPIFILQSQMLKSTIRPLLSPS